MRVLPRYISATGSSSCMQPNSHNNLETIKLQLPFFDGTSACEYTKSNREECPFLTPAPARSEEHLREKEQYKEGASTIIMADERTPLLGEAAGPSSKSSMLQLQAAATLGASLLGTGLLAQPRACETTGLVLFVFLSLLALTISHLAAMMLCRTSVFLASTSQSNPSGYADVVAMVLGRKGELLTMWSIALMQIGCCVGYVVVIGDVFTPLIAHWSHMSSSPSTTQIIYFAATFVLAPLCVFVRNLASLRFTSAIAMFVIMFFGAVVVGNGIYVISSSNPDEKRRDLIQDEDVELTGPRYFPSGTAALRAIPLVCFAYFMHFNVLPVLKTLHELGPLAESVYEKASKWSFMMSGSVTSSFGILGYLTFLSETDSDILSNFKVSGTYISSFLNVVRALYGVGLMLAFPIVLWEARENLKRIIFGGDKHHKVHSSSAASYSPLVADEFSELNDETNATILEDRVQGGRDLPLRDTFKVHAIISLLLVYLTATLGAVVSDLEVVFGLIGSTCTPVIAYVLPALVYLNSGAAARNDHELQAKIILGIGCGLVPLGLTVWILERTGKL